MFPVLTHPQYLWGVVEPSHSPQMVAQVNRTPWPLIALLIVGAGCGGGTDGTSVAPPTAPTPTPPTAPTPTPPPAPEPPGVPSSLRVSASGEDFVEWTWNAVEGADGYDVQFSLDKMFDSADEIIGRTADQTSYRRQPLPAGSTAFLRVRSASGSGDGRLTSDWSAHVSGMTPAPPPPAIEVTPVGRGISVTSENQILLELMSEDLAPANPLDLAGRTLMFTPDGRGGYSREVRALDWDEEADDAERMREPVEVELEHFRFPFAGREWDSFFYTRPGLISFGEPIPSDAHWPKRFGTMPQLFDLFAITPTISALYKNYLGGNVYVSNLPDRMIVAFFVYDQAFLVYGQRPKETFDFQIVLHSDGRIALNYGPEPQNPDEAFGDGIAGVFPGIAETGLLGSVPDRVDASVPAHLDLVETALYAAAKPDIVLVEFTTRGPIRPIPNQEIFYMVAIDDWDFVAGVALQPDGSRTARWDAAWPAYDRDVDDNRIGLLFDSGEFSGHSTSVRAFARSRNQLTGSWGPRHGEHSAVISFPEVADPAPIDLSQPDPRPSAAQYEVFRYPMIRDGSEGVGHVSCRIIEVLGDHFDLFAFNSEFRVDQQQAGPGHGFAGFYAGNIQAEVTGIGIEGTDTTPCESRLKNSWGYPVWMKVDSVADERHTKLPGQTPYDHGLTIFAHEMGHTWLAHAQYMKDGERRLMTAGGGSHWAFELHAPAPFPWWGTENGSVMGGSYWRENSDGTFTPTRGWSTKGGGFSWLDLYLMGLATPNEVPDMFVLHNVKQVGERWDGPYTAEKKEIVTMEQVLAAMGPRNPPPERAPKVFNIGFVYFLLPGQEPDPELLREHVRYRDRMVEHWRHVTGGRGQLSTELPGR